MFLKSIRWRMQIWYGLIFLLVLAGFGVAAFQLERGRVFRRIDGELHQRLTFLGGALTPARRPEPGQVPFGRPPRQRPPAPIGQFELPPRAQFFFDESDTNGFYYVIQDHEGKELARSANAPAPRGAVHDPSFVRENGLPQLRPKRARPLPPETRGTYRETEMVTPSGAHILVGCSIAPQLKELNLIALKLAGAGAVILLLGLAGGWWLASRAIRPIEDISATAVKISAGDLSQRISTQDTDSELGQLASVLNSTFARLETSFSQQRQFTSDAAHELRTPVSVLLTQTQTVLNRERSAAEYREAVEACQRAAQRMRRLLESLLELARLDAGQETLQRMPFDLARTAADCVEQIRPLAAERGITLHTEFSAADCLGDSERIAQVVTNLLSNAIHYNRENGLVRVRTNREGSFATVTVTDDGPGIAPEHKAHIFDRFYRVDAARTTAQGRTGLGLAICKSIVEAHGGTIEVSSQPGQETTFTVRLPASAGNSVKDRAPRPTAS